MRMLVWQKSKHFDWGKWNCGCRAPFLWFHSVSVERTLWTSMLLFLVHGCICLTLWWHILWAELLIHLTAIPLWGLDGAPGLLVLFMLHTSIQLIEASRCDCKPGGRGCCFGLTQSTLKSALVVPTYWLAVESQPLPGSVGTGSCYPSISSTISFHEKMWPCW